MLNIQKLLSLTPPMPMNAQQPKLHSSLGDRLIGLELETENIPYDPVGYLNKFVLGERDGSLRSIDGHYSFEYITQPMTYSDTVGVLETFFKSAGFTHKNYTERCSVHVHVNCQDLTVEQLQSICLLYQTFEPLLFAFVGGDRDKNIFCVPWSESVLNWYLISTIIESDQYKFAQWQKYTALNLVPLATYGTIEFRHLPGTCDMGLITSWLNIIGCLFRHALKHSINEIKDQVVNLNTTSKYVDICETVFGEYANILRPYAWGPYIEEGVLNVKYILMGEEIYLAKKSKKSSAKSNPFEMPIRPAVRPVAVADDLGALIANLPAIEENFTPVDPVLVRRPWNPPRG